MASPSGLRFWPLKGLVLVVLTTMHALPTNAEMLGEDALRKLATGNTITGRYTFGGWFSEFHAADGRVLGNNGWQDNQDACWTTKNDAICYSYGEAEGRQTYCFTVEKNGDSLLLRNLSNGLLNAVAKIEPENPRSHSDHGHNWNCDDRVSRLPSGMRLALRLLDRIKRPAHFKAPEPS